MNDRPLAIANRRDQLSDPVLPTPSVVVHRPARRLIVRIHRGLLSSIRSLAGLSGSRAAPAAVLAGSVFASLAAVTVTSAPARCQSAYTVRIDQGPEGAQTNLASWSPRISGDGRYLVYMSWATNLVPSDTNFTSDIFYY